MKHSSLLKILITSICILCILLGILVLVGWYTDNVRLIQVLPFFVPMQYNTALGFLLSGIGLLAALKNKKIIGYILFFIVGIMGLLTLLEYLLKVNFGIDQLLMEHYITVETSHPGRMAPNTALCFLLTAIAMILSIRTGHKKIQVSGVIGSLVFGLGIVAFVGYLINMEVTYGWGKLTKMAVHTALGFIAMGIGITLHSLYKRLFFMLTHKFNNDLWITGYAFSFSLIIFFMDLNLPLGIATGTLYVLIILFAWFIKQQHMIGILAIFTTLLIILGYFYSIGGAELWMVIANRAFSIMVIWVVAGLLFNIKKKENRLIATNKKLDLNLLELTNKNKELAQFTYIASHDLQEPLRTITNFTELFQQQYKDAFDEEAKTFLGFIMQASNRMRNLIKGLLDYSRIGHNKEKTTVDINKVLDELQIDLKSIIDETNTKFNLQPMPKIKGYKVELGLLFQNLILNAIKFRKEKVDPNITISVNEIDSFYEFSVKDNGIGIANQYQKKIFSIFQRLHSKEKYEGTGIGLAHCQKIVELHQGKIWVNSTPNEGSSFFFTIKKQ